MSAPTTGYGILEQDGREQIPSQKFLDQEFATTVKGVLENGFAVFDGGFSELELQDLSSEFNREYQAYVSKYGRKRLEELDELHTIRAMLTSQNPVFRNLALNQRLLKIIGALISGKFILNQQNGIINPPKAPFNQAHWHRDLPYQHFVSSRPLAINALFCVDDFTYENGATFVLPMSHKKEQFPTWDEVQKRSVQVTAKRGSFVVLDCMTFHAGGYNGTSAPRRAINHVYNIPFLKQQICLENWVSTNSPDMPAEHQEILGVRFAAPRSVEAFLNTRVGKK